MQFLRNKPLLMQMRKQVFQRRPSLQFTQARGIRRTDIDGQVIGVFREDIHKRDIIENGLLIGCILILAEVDPQHGATPMNGVDKSFLIARLNAINAFE